MKKQKFTLLKISFLKSKDNYYMADINELSLRRYDITLNALNNSGNDIVIYDFSAYLYATSLYWS